MQGEIIKDESTVFDQNRYNYVEIKSFDELKKIIVGYVDVVFLSTPDKTNPFPLISPDTVNFKGNFTIQKLN